MILQLLTPQLIKKATIVLLVAIGACAVAAVAYGAWFLYGMSRYL